MSMDNKSLTAVDLIRFFAAIGIVILHSFLEKEGFMNIYGSEYLGRWCVGFFFLITGFFIKDSLKDTIKYCIKILTIYIPANIIYALYFHIDIWSVRRFLFALRNGVIMPFWYFPSLILCVIFIFVLRRFIKSPICLCIITGILFVFALMGNTWSNIEVINNFMDKYFLFSMNE